MMKMTEKEKADRAQRRREAIKLQEIEGNPVTAEDIAIFEMFDREGFTDQQRIDYIKRQAIKRRDAAPE